MTRIIAGTARGRRIAVPPGLATRPTSDRVREGLFSTVEALLGSLRGRWVLDLYAGSGAVGLEALSRGAGHALMVESSRSAVRVIRGNIAALGLPGAQVVAGDVGRVVARGPRGQPGGFPDEEGRYSFVFVDPPYGVGEEQIESVLTGLVSHEWLAAGALAVVERGTGSPVAWPDGYVADRVRRYGDTTLWYGLAAGG